MTIQEKQRLRKLEVKKLNLEEQILVINQKQDRLNYQVEQLRQQIERLASEMTLLVTQDGQVLEDQQK